MPNRHALQDSPFYRLRSPHKLAQLLYCGLPGLRKLADATPASYSCWQVPKKSCGFRQIEAPYENLKNVQKRIAALLHRIEAPEFLMAPVKGRSYVHNAAQHVGSRCFSLLDLEDFFPSCTQKRVFWFFNSYMECSADVSGLLARICTFNGRLPQGSPCSPILAYLAYIDMWADIDGIAKEADLKFTLYADDMTLSGSVVYQRDIWAIKKLLHRFGHRYSPQKERHTIGKSVDVTGVIVGRERLLLPNRQHKKLADARRLASRSSSQKEKDSYERKLRGREAQARQILEHLRPQCQG